jgi:hypothetical protein
LIAFSERKSKNFFTYINAINIRLHMYNFAMILNPLQYLQYVHKFIRKLFGRKGGSQNSHQEVDEEAGHGEDDDELQQPAGQAATPHPEPEPVPAQHTASGFSLQIRSECVKGLFPLKMNDVSLDTTVTR